MKLHKKTLLGYGLLTLTLTSLLVGCEFSKVTNKTSDGDTLTNFNLTSSIEVKERVRRKENLKLYKTYLKENNVDVTSDMTYDYIEQLVYNALPEKESVYNVTLFSLEGSETVPDDYTYTHTPVIEFTNVTQDSDVPDVIKLDLQLGNSVIEYNDQPHLRQVRYAKCDLSDWRTSYASVTRLGGE